MRIQQNDQYTITLKIKQGNTLITDDNVDEMVIKIGDVEKCLSKSEISYDDDSNLWCYPLNKSQTSEFKSDLKVQAQFIIGTNIFNTPVATIDVRKSIIKG